MHLQEVAPKGQETPLEHNMNGGLGREEAQITQFASDQLLRVRKWPHPTAALFCAGRDLARLDRFGGGRVHLGPEMVTLRCVDPLSVSQHKDPDNDG